MQVVEEVQDLHLELITVAQESQTPELSKYPVEQVRQVAPVNPEAQTRQVVPVVHCMHLGMAAEQDKQPATLSR